MLRSILRKLIQNKFGVMENVLSYRGLNYKENNLKGTGIHFELAGGSSYRGFKLLRVELQ